MFQALWREFSDQERRESDIESGCISLSITTKSLLLFNLIKRDGIGDDGSSSTSAGSL